LESAKKQKKQNSKELLSLPRFFWGGQMGEPIWNPQKNTQVVSAASVYRLPCEKSLSTTFCKNGGRGNGENRNWDRIKWEEVGKWRKQGAGGNGSTFPTPMTPISYIFPIPHFLHSPTVPIFSVPRTYNDCPPFTPEGSPPGRIRGKGLSSGERMEMWKGGWGKGNWEKIPISPILPPQTPFPPFFFPPFLPLFTLRSNRAKTPQMILHCGFVRFFLAEACVPSCYAYGYSFMWLPGDPHLHEYDSHPCVRVVPGSGSPQKKVYTPSSLNLQSPFLSLL